MLDLNTASRDELLGWIDYLQTKVDRLHTHIEYLTEMDPRTARADVCLCEECTF